jgi:formylglycine-generating enzyme required for sulfatase activity
MSRLEGGAFLMGSNDSQSYLAEEPPHRVTLKPFLAAAREVTVAEFRAFAETSGYASTAERSGGAWTLGDDGLFAFAAGASWRDPGFPQGGDEPVVCVSWEDAVAYCDWLSLLQGLEPAYSRSGEEWSCDWSSRGYRLPTEAEWEFAARAGRAAKDKGPFGGVAKAEAAGWVLGNSGGRTRAVGSKPANANGLYDVCGNVFEWCWDRFGQDYYALSPPTDPRGPEIGQTRVLRGGSWASRPRNARSTQRYARAPDEPSSYVGFRLFQSIPE